MKSMQNKFISMFLCLAMLLSIVTTMPITTASANSNECRVGGIIASPINQGHTGAYVINGNALRNGTNAALDINVKDLINGTCIKANDIYGIQALIWAPQANTRQLYFEVNGVASPMFCTDTTDPARIFMPRESVHPITYSKASPFVNTASPSTFTIRIRAGNAVWGVGPISLLGVNGEVLGTSVYSSQGSVGTWSPFTPNCDCCEECGKNPCICPCDCGELTCLECNPPCSCGVGGTIALPINMGLTGAHVINGNVLRNNTNAALDINVLNLIAGTNVKASDVRGIEAQIWSLDGSDSGNTRQLYFEVNGVASPMFCTDTTDPARIFMPRAAVHNVTWSFNTAQRNAITSNNFTIRIRANNAVWGVGPISLFGSNGQVLGTSAYSTQDSNGGWDRFTPVCKCGNPPVTTPAVTIDEPASTTAPATTTTEPAATTTSASVATTAPENTTSSPAATTTEPPAVTTAPVTTTTAPAVTTTEPAVTTDYIPWDGNEDSDYPEDLETLNKQFLMYASGENALQLNASNVTINGNIYAGGNLEAYSGRVDIYGRTQLGGKVKKHEHTIFNRLQYIENSPVRNYPHFTQAVVNSLGSNYITHQYWQTYSNTNVTNSSSIYAKSGLQFTASNVTLQNTIISDEYLLISASNALNTPAGKEVNLYVKNGNIGIYVGDIDINGIIYAPNGIVQICGTNININGAIIAKEIMISGQNVTINENYDLSLAEHILTGRVEIPFDQDSDDDWLPDYYEIFEFETDPFEADTDDDGLNDGLEVLILEYNPLSKDTDENGVEDGDEDFDGDVLTNILEVQYGTDLTVTDTDGDGLSDGDEVHIYGTAPLNLDTDNDGLLDGEEGYNGIIYAEHGVYLDPLNPDTLGDGILDGDRIFGVSFSGELSDNGAIKPHLTIELQGKQVNSFTIEKVDEDDLFLRSQIPGYLGNAYDFNVNGTFSTATLTYELDASFFNDPNFVPAIYYWNEETQFLDELPNQIISGNTVSAELKHFSIYIVLDKNKRDSAFNNFTILVPSDEGDQDRKFDVVFVLDDSSGISSANFNSMKTQCTNLIGKLTNNDEIAVYSINGGGSPGFVNNNNATTVISNLTQYTGGNTGTSLYGTIYSAATLSSMNSRKDAEKIIIVLTAGETTNNGPDSIFMAKQSNIVIYTIGVGTVAGKSDLEYIAVETGGKYYPLSDFSNLDVIFNRTLTDADLYMDSDSDGILDYYEKKVSAGELLLGTGSPMEYFGNLSYLNPDTDGDGLLDGEEIEIVPRGSGKFICCFIYMSSNPCMNDSDEDGVRDNKDAEPIKHFDKRFMVVDDFDYIPTVEFVERHFAKGLECYDTKSATAEDYAWKAAFLSVAAAGFSTPSLQLLLGNDIKDINHFLIILNIISTIPNLVTAPNFSDYLVHYLANSGNQLDLTQNKMHSIINTQKSNKQHYSYNINQLRMAAESMIKQDNDTYNISTTPGNNFKVACYKAHNCSKHSRSYDNSTSADWGYAIGEASGGMTAEVKKIGDRYFMTSKYYLIDTYEFAVHWDESLKELDNITHSLHECGLAKEYKIVGVYEETFEWNKGELIYADDYIDINLDVKKYNNN